MRNETNLSIEEKVASLFQPDILIAGQYFETVRRRASLEPEKRLMLAVLEDAIRCFQKCSSAGDRRRQSRFSDAEDWIMEENSEWLFSFENICQVLGFNPAYLRRGLMSWRREKLLYVQLVKKTKSLSLELDHRISKSHVGKRESTAMKEVYQEKRLAQLS